ncbi:MAG: Aureobasidin resistance protein Aur1, partial [Chaenotheca gracillima]
MASSDSAHPFPKEAGKKGEQLRFWKASDEAGLPVDIKGVRSPHQKLWAHWKVYDQRPHLVNAEQPDTIPPKNVRLSDAFVGFVVQAGISPAIRARSWPADFNANGDVRADRRPKGRPSLIEGMIADYRGYYLLVGGGYLKDDYNHGSPGKVPKSVTGLIPSNHKFPQNRMEYVLITTPTNSAPIISAAPNVMSPTPDVATDQYMPSSQLGTPVPNEGPVTASSPMIHVATTTPSVLGTTMTSGTASQQASQPAGEDGDYSHLLKSKKRKLQDTPGPGPFEGHGYGPRSEALAHAMGELGAEVVNGTVTLNTSREALLGANVAAITSLHSVLEGPLDQAPAQIRSTIQSLQESAELIDHDVAENVITAPKRILQKLKTMGLDEE